MTFVVVALLAVVVGMVLVVLHVCNSLEKLHLLLPLEPSVASVNARYYCEEH
jgi:hypothetical protein